MRDVEIDVSITNQTIVADHRHALLMRGFDDRRGNLSVVRSDDQDVDALRQKRFALVHLRRVVAVRDQHLALSALFFAALFNQLLVTLPAFLFQSVHGKTYAHRAGAFGSFASTAFRAFDTSGAQNSHRQGKKNQFQLGFHSYHPSTVSVCCRLGAGHIIL